MSLWASRPLVEVIEPFRSIWLWSSLKAVVEIENEEISELISCKAALEKGIRSPSFVL